MRPVKLFILRQLVKSERKSSKPGSHRLRLQLNEVVTPRAPYGGRLGPQDVAILLRLALILICYQSALHAYD